MNQAPSKDIDRIAHAVSGDLKTLVADGEELLKSAVAVSGEGFAAARARFGERLAGARRSLATAQHSVVEGTRRSAAATDGYVHEHPWRAVGVAVAVGALIGVLASRR